MNEQKYNVIKYIDGGVDIDVYEIEEEFYLIRKDILNLLSIGHSTFAKIAKEAAANNEIIPNKFQKMVFNHSKRPVIFYPLNLVKEMANKHNYGAFLKLMNWLSETRTYPINIDMEIVRFNQDNLSFDVTVSPKEKTVWLSQKEMAILYDTTQQNISLHINNIFKDGELEECSVHKEYLYTGPDGKNYLISSYNLKMVLAVGYRVKTKRAFIFKNWASNILERYMIGGHAINETRCQRYPECRLLLDNKVLELDRRMNNAEEDIKEMKIERLYFAKNRALEPFTFLSSMVMMAKESIYFIDPYADGFTISVLTTKPNNVKAVIVGSKKSDITDESLELFRRQNGNIKFIKNNDNHKRYLIVDKKICIDIDTSTNSFGYYNLNISILRDKKTIEEIIETSLQTSLQE